MNLPLPHPGRGRVLARGVLLDYALKTIDPCTLSSIALLLSALDRYGVHRPVGATCNLLVHSVRVGQIAERLGKLAIASPPRRGALNLYGRLHDIGECLGGDVVSMAPHLAHFRDYQSEVRRSLQEKLGLPKPSEQIKAILKVADLLIVPVEISEMNGGKITLEQALGECQASSGLETTLCDLLEAIPGLEDRTPLSLVEEASAFKSMSIEEATDAFCRPPAIHIAVDENDTMIGAYSGSALDAAFHTGVSRVVSTRSLGAGFPAESWMVEQVHAGFAKNGGM